MLAAVVRLLETTLIRVGNEEYARDQQLLRPDDPARPARRIVRARRSSSSFRGKSGIKHTIDAERPPAGPDRQALPATCPARSCSSTSTRTANATTIGSADVNDYLREITGEDFTAKDFRTWAGTVLAAMALQEFEAFDSQTQAKKNVVRAIERSPSGWATRPTVCRKCYVHPAIIDSYLDGSMLETLPADEGRDGRIARRPAPRGSRRHGSSSRIAWHGRRHARHERASRVVA